MNQASENVYGMMTYQCLISLVLSVCPYIARDFSYNLPHEDLADVM